MTPPVSPLVSLVIGGPGSKGVGATVVPVWSRSAWLGVEQYSVCDKCIFVCYYVLINVFSLIDCPKTNDLKTFV